MLTIINFASGKMSLTISNGGISRNSRYRTDLVRICPNHKAMYKNSKSRVNATLLNYILCLLEPLSVDGGFFEFL